MLNVEPGQPTNHLRSRRRRDGRRPSKKAGRDALRLLGTDHEVTLKVRANYATAIQHDDATTQEDLLEAMDMMMELRKTSRRLLGEDHPTTELI